MADPSSALLLDDPLYEELYDVRREAMELGNLVEEDMSPAMSALRERAPVQAGYVRELLGLPPHQRSAGAEGRPGYSCFSWQACNMAFRAHERFSSKILSRTPAAPEPWFGMLEMDEPVHQAYRATIQPLFLKPRAFTWWRTRWIDGIVHSLVERLRHHGRAELNLQLCARIPVHTITLAVGMEGQEALTFRRAMMRASAAAAGTSPEEQQACASTVERMLLELVARKRLEPGDDLVSELIKAQLKLPDGSRRPLTDREIMIHARLVLLAGGGTSWRQMGITLWALLTHREQLEAVKADRTLLERAVDEAVRWNPTDPVFNRLVVADTVLEDVLLPAGSVLEICLGAANRDPSRWDHPDAYDVHRPVKSHLGFGMGTHHCLGMNVGKAEIVAAIDALLNACPQLRLDPQQPPPHLTGGLEQRGMSAIPVLLR
jgi:cytochrome P450